MFKSIFTAATLALSFSISSNTWAAPESAATDIPSAGAQARQQADLQAARTGLGRVLEAWRGDADTSASIEATFSEKGFVELSLPGRPEWALRIDGQSAISEYVDTLRNLEPQWQFSEVQFYPTLQAGVVFAQFEAHGGNRHLRNMLVIELDGLRIARLRDLTGASLVMQALTNPDNAVRLPRRVAQN